MNTKLGNILKTLIITVLLAAAAPFASMAEPDTKAALDSVSPSLVYIRVVCRNYDSGKNRRQEASGSGVIISADGELLTNHHVIDKADEIRCLLSDGRAMRAKVLGKDKDLDIALLKLEPAKESDATFSPASLSSSGVEVGDTVFALGAPWGLARSVSRGIVSCIDRYLPECGPYTLWYQTDAAISPGNSGGPLVNGSGLVVGINARGTSMGAQAFTIPSTTILEILPNMRKHGGAHWTWLGARFQPLNDFDHDIFFDADSGVIVSGTDESSPARAAGFMANDRIVAVDGAPVTVRNWEAMPAFERELGRREPGKEIVFDVVRGGKAMKIAATPREKGAVEGDAKTFEKWGVSLKEINAFDRPDLAFFADGGKGVFVCGIEWGESAYETGIRENDIVTALGDVEVKTLADVSKVYDASAKGSRVTMSVRRGQRSLRFVISTGKEEDKENDDE